MPKNDRAGKAALLADLIGVKRFEEMENAGMLSGKTPGQNDAASLEWHRNRLIEKFRERGLIPVQEPNHQSKTRSTTVNSGPTKQNEGQHPDFEPGAIGTRLAKHLNPDRISDEHPAVIALLLRSQPANLRSEILRGLPGAQARAVMRILRAGRTPPVEPPNTEHPRGETRIRRIKPKPKSVKKPGSVKTSKPVAAKAAPTEPEAGGRPAGAQAAKQAPRTRRSSHE